MRTESISTKFRIALSVCLFVFCQLASAANATGLGFGLVGYIILLVLTAVAVTVKYLLFPIFCVYVCFWFIKKTRFYGSLVSLYSYWQTKLPYSKNAFESIKKHKYVSYTAAFFLWGFIVYLVSDGFFRL